MPNNVIIFQDREVILIIQNSKKILNELSQIEREITQIEQLIYKQSLNIDSVKLLEDILKSYCRES